MNGLPEVAKRLKIELTPAQLQSFETYSRLLLSERKRAALTSLADRQSIELRHFGESLALLQALEARSPVPLPIIDVGAGAGFPSVPMKLVRPEFALTLLEANQKKADFLRRLVDTLALNSVAVINARAEQAAHVQANRGAFGLALARAVAPLRVLVELALPFVAIDGLLATPKGSGAAREIREAERALSVCGGEVASVEPLSLPWTAYTPTLVLIRKTAETPDRYPRRAGIPSKRPL